MKTFHKLSVLIGSNTKSFTLLLTRLILAYGFYETAIPKWHNIQPTAEWFASLGIPAPLLSVYATAIFESLGAVLLILGFFTRAISIPLVIIILVAIFTVHFHNGYSVANNGFEIPLYYVALLLTLLAFGAGKISVDYAVFKDE